MGAVYPALNIYSVYSDRSVVSQSWTQSSSLLAGHLSVNSLVPSKSQPSSARQSLPVERSILFPASPSHVLTKQFSYQNTSNIVISILTKDNII